MGIKDYNISNSNNKNNNNNTNIWSETTTEMEMKGLTGRKIEKKRKKFKLICYTVWVIYRERAGGGER